MISLGRYKRILQHTKRRSDELTHFLKLLERRNLLANQLIVPSAPAKAGQQIANRDSKRVLQTCTHTS